MPSKVLFIVQQFERQGKKLVASRAIEVASADAAILFAPLPGSPSMHQLLPCHRAVATAAALALAPTLTPSTCRSVSSRYSGCAADLKPLGCLAMRRPIRNRRQDPDP